MFVSVLTSCETYRSFSDALDKSVDENRRDMTAQAITRLNVIGVGKITSDKVRIRSTSLENGVNKWVAETPRNDALARPWLWDCRVPNKPDSFNAQHTFCTQSACYPNCE